jgi:uncharacterized membrane protein YeaQ/YmgE (transglycosylase-associated protein family)
MEILGYSPLHLLVLLVIAAACGALVQAVPGFSVGGCLISLVLAFVGALFGAWVATYFALPTLFELNIGGEAYPIVWPLLGAALFALILSLLVQRLIVDT